MKNGSKNGKNEFLFSENLSNFMKNRSKNGKNEFLLGENSSKFIKNRSKIGENEILLGKNKNEQALLETTVALSIELYSMVFSEKSHLEIKQKIYLKSVKKSLSICRKI